MIKRSSNKTPTPLRANVLRWGILGLFFLFFYGCNAASSEIITSSSLFFLNYGKQEKELELYVDAAPGIPEQFSVHFANGFVYISNAQTAKILVLSSYGDLLQLYYNPDKVLHPVSLQEVDTAKKTTTFAVPYSSALFGKITVLSDATLVVVEQIPSHRIDIDPNTGVRLAYQLRLFSSEGEILQSIGQEGLGGTPFPVIESVFAIENNGIVVVANFLDEKRVFVYSNNFSLLYEVWIPLNELPVPFVENIIPQLSLIVPRFSGDMLYVHIHYYQQKLSTDNQAIHAIEYLDSSIYTLSLETQQYTQEIDADIENDRYGLAEFVGVSRSNHLYFIRYLDSKEVEIISMNQTGKVLLRHQEPIGEILGLHTSITATDDILTLLIREAQAEVVLWDVSNGIEEE